MTVSFTLAIAFMGCQSPALSLGEGEQLARAFTERARLGRLGAVAGDASPLVLRSRRVLPGGGSAVYELGSAKVRVDLIRRSIASFTEDFSGVDLVWSESERMGEQELESLATELLRVAGISGRAVVHHVDLYGSNGPEGSICAHALPTSAGIPFAYDWAVLLTVEHRSGRLYQLTRLNPDLPEPPPLATPALSPAAARLTMASEILVARPQVALLAAAKDAKLVFWAPRGADSFAVNRLTEAQAQMGRENKALLAYWAYFLAEPLSPHEPGPAFEAFLDARTGRLLAINAFEGPWAGEPGGAVPRPFGWDLGPGPLTITLGGKTYELSSADVLKVQQGSPNEPGVPVLLQRARLILNALYYPKAILLSVGEGKLRSFGRPDEELKKALSALAAKE